MCLWFWHDSIEACDTNISHLQGIAFDIDSTHASAIDLKCLVMAFRSTFMKNMFTADPNCLPLQDAGFVVFYNAA
jgi:hypothetical protein